MAYSNTLDSPFQWDDKSTFVKENPLIKDLSYFLRPSKAEGHELYSALKGRYIGYLTFALNYKINGLDVTGYHAVNILIHILNSLLVYSLVVLTFKTPFLSGSLLKGRRGEIALFTSLLFVSHPVQTEAVTYIFQRLASLVAFFYLMSLALYASARLSSSAIKRTLFYALSLISAIAAMKTKENAFTLPIVIALYELFFFRGPIEKRMAGLIPFILTMFIVSRTLLGAGRTAGEMVGGIASLTQGDSLVSGGDYLITQIRVAATYIRLLFFPVNQNIDYDYPIFNSFLSPPVILSLLLHALVIGAALYLLFRSSKKEPELRLISFGILWFFITLSVESSVIPIPMVINEYRVYLPSFGAFAGIAAGIFMMIERPGSPALRRLAVTSLILVPFLLSSAAYARNNLWGSELSLWKDTAGKSINGARAHNNLGIAYKESGLFKEAEDEFNESIRLKPGFIFAHNNLGVLYRRIGRIDDAIKQYEIALKINPVSSKAHNNLGFAYESKGLINEALEHYEQAVGLDPYNAEAHINLGNAYSSLEKMDKAILHYEEAIRLRPDIPDTYNNLGTVYWSKGLYDKAIECYAKAIERNLDYAEVYFNMGLAYDSKGIQEKAKEYFKTAIRLKPELAKSLKNPAYLSE